MTGQEATVIDIGTEVDALASWPTRERTRALKRIIPRARVEEVLARTGHDRARCRRLPGWFLVWFVIALGLFCRDCYRQVFRWLQPFRPGAIPPRSTLCEARQRLGVAPMRLLAEQVIRLQDKPTTPGAFYRGMRTMVEFPPDGGRPVTSVSSDTGAHHADDTKDVHPRVQGRGRQARHRAGT